MTTIVHAETLEVTTFTDLFKVLGNVTPEVTIDFAHNGLHIMLMTPCRNCVVNVEMSANNFIKYQCTPAKVSFGIPLSHLNNILHITDKHAQLIISADDTSMLKICSLHPMGRSCCHTIQPLDLTPNKQIEPNTEYDVSFEMPTNELHRLCKHLAKFCKNLTIKHTSDKISFIGDSYGIKGEIFYATNQYKGHCKGDNVETIGQYPLQMINQFSSCVDLCPTVEISMNVELYPIRLRYKIGTFGDMDVYIAPI